jgi:hypothetical protein
VTLLQDGEPRAGLLASFADDRSSTLAVDGTRRNPPPVIAAPEAIEPRPHVPGVMAEFFVHFELRYVGAALPMTGAPEPDFGGWMRFAEPPQRFGDRELVTLADAWPPAIAPMLDGPVALSSLAWTFEPVAWPDPAEPDAPDAHWQYDVRTLAAGDGYAHTHARIWDARARLRAVSSQTVAYFV